MIPDCIKTPERKQEEHAWLAVIFPCRRIGWCKLYAFISSIINLLFSSDSLALVLSAGADLNLRYSSLLLSPPHSLHFYFRSLQTLNTSAKKKQPRCAPIAALVRFPFYSFTAETINSTRHSCLPAYESPSYQARAERLDRQKAAPRALRGPLLIQCYLQCARWPWKALPPSKL